MMDDPVPACEASEKRPHQTRRVNQRGHEKIRRSVERAPAMGEREEQRSRLAPFRR